MFGSSSPFGQSSTSPFGQTSFGAQQQQGFGQPSTATNNPFAPKPFGSPTTAFGAQTGSSLFGNTSTGAFGQQQSTPTFGTPSSSPFGSSTPAFGASPTPAFGASSSTPAFGATSSTFGSGSLFGQKPSFGGFGSSPSQSSPFGGTFQQQTQPTFGSSTFGATTTPAFGTTTTPAFGATTAPAFGATTPAFGATSTPAFGATTTPAFGSTSTSLFGASSTPAFGSTAFGSSPAFGSTGTTPFGVSSTPGFGSSSAPSSGTTSAFSFGSSPSFGQTAVSSGSSPFGTTPSAFGVQTSPFGSQTAPSFGQAQFGNQAGGTRIKPYAQTPDADSTTGGTQPAGKLDSISAMPEYKDKSHEELRWEDYQRGDKGGPNPAGIPAATPSFQVPQTNPFNTTPATNPNPFSFAPKPSTGFNTSTSPFNTSFNTASVASSSPFTSSTSTAMFGGQTGLSAFPSSTTPSLFSNTTSSFGTSSLFGSSTANNSSPFGTSLPLSNTQSAPLFQSTPALQPSNTQPFSGSLFSTPNSGSLFGGGQPSLFPNPSAPAQTSNMFSFQSPIQPASTGGFPGFSNTTNNALVTQQTPSLSSMVMQPAPVSNPFGTLPAMPQMSIGNGGSSPSVQYGISSWPSSAFAQTSDIKPGDHPEIDAAEIKFGADPEPTRGDDHANQDVVHRTLVLPVPDDKLEYVKDVEKRMNKVLLPKYGRTHESKQPPTIYTVPQEIKRGNEDAYLPFAVTIGPLMPYEHRKRRYFQYQHLQDYKWCCVRSLIGRQHLPEETDRKTALIHRCLDDLRSLEQRILASYPKDLHPSFPPELLLNMLLDGCFILHRLLKYARIAKREETMTLEVKPNTGTSSSATIGNDEEDDDDWTQVFGRCWVWGFVNYDLLMLENQIPFFVVEKLFHILRTDANESSDILVSGALRLFRSLRPQPMPMQSSHIACRDVHHLLHLFYKLVDLPVPATETAKPANNHRNRYNIMPSSELSQWTPSATELENAGIKFRARQGVALSFLDIKFNGGVLEIPMLQLYDYSEHLLRNLIAFEQTYPRTPGHVTAYAIFMDCLVASSEDMRLLQLRGVLKNQMNGERDKDQQIGLFSRLCHGVHFAADRNYLGGVISDVNKYQQARWPRWRAALLRNYFSNPWLATSLVAAVFLLGLTVLQTFFAAYSYFKPPN